jgi:hypothetical protein
MNNPSRTHQLLTELLEVLNQEHEGLRRLDQTLIQAAADRKLDLDEQLRAIPKTEIERESVDLLRRVRASAERNALLLAHARSCVQGVINLILGQDLNGHTSSRKPVAPRPVAFNFRG